MPRRPVKYRMLTHTSPDRQRKINVLAAREILSVADVESLLPLTDQELSVLQEKFCLDLAILFQNAIDKNKLMQKLASVDVMLSIPLINRAWMAMKRGQFNLIRPMFASLQYLGLLYCGKVIDDEIEALRWSVDRLQKIPAFTGWVDKGNDILAAFDRTPTPERYCQHKHK